MAPVFGFTWRSAKEKRPFCGYTVPSDKNQFELQLAQRRVVARQAEIFLLADREIGLDRIERRDRGDSVARRTHQIADLRRSRRPRCRRWAKSAW